jgi:hypothetical protein
MKDQRHFHHSLMLRADECGKEFDNLFVPAGTVERSPAIYRQWH